MSSELSQVGLSLKAFFDLSNQVINSDKGPSIRLIPISPETLEREFKSMHVQVVYAGGKSSVEAYQEWA